MMCQRFVISETLMQSIGWSRICGKRLELQKLQASEPFSLIEGSENASPRAARRRELGGAQCPPPMERL